jgi:hypothetical protein
LKNIDFDKVWIGLIIGFLTPVIVYTLYYYFVCTTGITKVNISVCIAVNIIPFQVYSKQEKNKGLKGVFIATILWALFIAYISLFTYHLNIG